PFGPFLASRDEVKNPHELTVSLKVDGRTLQSGTTRKMLFNVADLVAYLSTLQVLEPGDIIATGTPAGVGMGFSPPKWLRAGDVVRIEIDGIGAIENRFE
ncbi:MAG TPA: fumarylacetoacetate hydrolase family protein, partial [Burkholderiaceae bacterium]